MTAGQKYKFLAVPMAVELRISVSGLGFLVMASTLNTAMQDCCFLSATGMRQAKCFLV